MKKLLFVVLALLLTFGVANAGQIPMVVDPANYPEIWTTEVYNNSGGALGSGTVVVWDFNSVSSPAEYTDRLNYVTTTSTADDIRVAGVLADNSCPSANTCTMVIRGPFYVTTADSTDAVTASTSVGTSVVPGRCCDSGGSTTNTAVLGYSIYASDNTVANGGYATTDGTDGTKTVVYINPTNN